MPANYPQGEAGFGASRRQTLNPSSWFDYYFCDGTALKTIIRSNPGLVLLQNGVVVSMWHYNDFPSWDDVNKQYLKK